MDIIVLGLLMMQNCTIYEMRKIIDTQFINISSDSMGSIQAAIKKLMDKGMINFSEYVENSVNKKVYSITDTGKAFFYQAVSSPMLYKEKNMELRKLFFMGFTEKSKWQELLDAYIGELAKELEQLEVINAAISPRFALDETDLEKARIRGAAEEITVDNINHIALFQYATLDLSIAKIKFEIQWFKDFKQSLY